MFTFINKLRNEWIFIVQTMLSECSKINEKHSGKITFLDYYNYFMQNINLKQPIHLHSDKRGQLRKVVREKQ